MLDGYPFTKVQSVGNNFVLIDLNTFPNFCDLDDNPSDQCLLSFVTHVCEPRFGVGSDGLLGVKMEGEFLRVRMFNNDATEDFCGNGLRCAAHWAYQRGWIGERVIAKHLGRDVPIEIDPATMLIRTQIGKADFEPSSVPLAPGTGEMFEVPIQVLGREIVVSTLSTGTAHTIVFTDELPKDEEFFKLGPALEYHELYPERTSIMWTRVVGDWSLELRIWERGVGETFGCGTGTTAAAATYMRKTGLTGTIKVQNPGGLLQVSGSSWQDLLWLEGKAEIVFEGRYRF